MVADTVMDEQVRALWVSMAHSWTKLAEAMERLKPHQGTRGADGESQDKPKSRLAAHAPQCARCRAPMKVRILFPGRKVDDVTYRCEQCGGEVEKPVPRAR